jgi:hypothetical protein
MTKETKTRAELEQMIIAEARKSGKCSALPDLSIAGPRQGQQNNWDFMIMRLRSGPPPKVSADCHHELRMIAGRLQAQYDLSGD